MPIGTGTGKHFIDDFELAMHEYPVDGVIKPNDEQMRDPMEIAPETAEQREFNPELNADFKPIADWFFDKPKAPAVSKPTLDTPSPQDRLEGSFKGVLNAERGMIDRVIEEKKRNNVDVMAGGKE